MPGHHLYAVVPAGGAGTRLWPLSRAASPKFLHDLTGSGQTLLEATVSRLRPLVGDRVVVVTGQAHRSAVAAQVPERVRILVEPEPRDSMAAIGLAAAVLEREDPDAVLGSFAADHVIDPEGFEECVRAAAAAAAEGWLVTIGIRPTHPATGFGYIEVGEPLPGHPEVHRAIEFVEKPTATVAAGYLAAGRHRWNAGMFVVGARVLLDLLAESDQVFADRLREIAAQPHRLARIWPELPRIAIDHAVAEPAAAAGRVAVVPGDFAWTDVGDFAALSEVAGAVLGDDSLVHAPDGARLVVPGSGRPVVVLGAADLVVVDTPEALLITTVDRAQQVRGAIEWLRSTGRDDLL